MTIFIGIAINQGNFNHMFCLYPFSEFHIFHGSIKNCLLKLFHQLVNIGRLLYFFPKKKSLLRSLLDTISGSHII